MQNEIRYFSMFTGVGGFELGFGEANNIISQSEKWESKERGNRSSGEQGTQFYNRSISPLRFIPVGFSEIDKYASELLKNKFPNTKNYGDATKIEPRELPDFDMLCGGFPCQAFSIAGKRRGFEDTRGTMFFEVARILEVKRPKIVFLENVKGLLNHNQGETFSVIIQTLDELGYDVQWMVLNSKFFGVPQNRERVFIIGSLRGESRPEILPFRAIDREDNEEGRGQLSSTFTSTYWKGWGGGRPLITHPTITGAIGRQGSSKEYMQSLKAIHNIYGGFNEGARFTDISPTLRTPKGGGHLPMIMDLYNNKEHQDRSPTLTEPHHNTLRVREGMKIRRLTPTECERLQGFPDGWTEGFSDTQRYKMMGNAVTTKVVGAIANKIRSQ